MREEDEGEDRLGHAVHKDAEEYEAGTESNGEQDSTVTCEAPEANAKAEDCDEEHARKRKDERSSDRLKEAERRDLAHYCSYDKRAV